MSKQKKYLPETRKFSDEDNVRISRLREEIIVRITEISMIMARTLAVPLPTDIREYIITDGPAGELLEMSTIKTSAPAAEGGTATIITWGCTCHANKICCSDPDCPPCP
jgi:hypothetical protein